MELKRCELVLLPFFTVLINLSLQQAAFAVPRLPRTLKRLQEATNAKTNLLGVRHKRAWIIDTFELQEEHPGPYPVFIGTINVENGFQVRYKLTGSGVTEDPIGRFHIDEDDGAIYVHDKIDFEKHSLFRWEFNAINRTSLNVDTRLGIHLKIIDINDNAPEFSAKSYEVFVNESAVQGVSFFSLVARDKDEPSTPNSEVSYSMLLQTPSDPNIEFTIDRDKGFLSFKGCLDYETNKLFKLVIQAKDNGKPVSQSSTCEVRVFVIDRNNKHPMWKEPQYDGSTSEREKNVTVLRVSVTDQDSPHTSAWRAVYTIKSGNEKGNFRIDTDPKTNDGLLTVIKPLDFEASPLNELALSVANEEPFFTCKVLKKSMTGLWSVDAGKPLGRKMQETPTTSVTVKVLDVNDPPEFHPDKTTVYMEETEVIGQKLGVLNATDPDTAIPNVIKYLVYSDPAGWISVDEHTGVISSRAGLDRESEVVVNNTYTALLLAVDDGVPPMTGTATLVINLKDVNDNTPQISMPYVTICAGQEEALITVPVVDKDINPYSGPFHFELLGKDDLKEQLELKDIHGDSLQVIQLKNARRGNHTMHFQISDKQGTTSLQNLTVHVCECINGGVCVRSASSPPFLGGGAILLLLLACLLLCVGCLLLCRINTEKVMVPFDQEPLNTMVVYNEEAGNKDCEAAAVLVPNQSMVNGVKEEVHGNFHRASTKRYNVNGVKDEVDGNFHRASTKRYNEQAVGASKPAMFVRSFSTESHRKNELQSELSHFDRANKRRHSSYTTREQQRTRRHERGVVRSHSLVANTRYSSLGRNMSPNGYRAHTMVGSAARKTSLITDDSMTDYRLKTLETYLQQTLLNSGTEEKIQEACKPHVYAIEGEQSRASSLESISMVGSNFNLDHLHALGSKFNILENICAEEIQLIELISQPEDEDTRSTSTSTSSNLK